MVLRSSDKSTQIRRENLLVSWNHIFLVLNFTLDHPTTHINLSIFPIFFSSLFRCLKQKQKKEEEVKKANRIILATKCSIIRNAQIAEKNEIAREFHNENLRLEKIMLEERDKALVEEELKREHERKSLLQYSKEIRKQLEERESIRAREVERIEEEAIAMKKSLDVMEKVRMKIKVGFMP